ncbi:MAG TPA: alkaline phosphatase, partial [Alteromonas sp.]|nr:alkaline phosphatase [Alteromonas sp.]
EVFAFGAGSNQFYGQYDNTDIAKKLFGLLPAQQKAEQVKAKSKAQSEKSQCDFETDWRCE